MKGPFIRPRTWRSRLIEGGELVLAVLLLVTFCVPFGVEFLIGKIAKKRPNVLAMNVLAVLWFTALMMGAGIYIGHRWWH